MSNRRTRRCNIRAPNWISRRPFFHACRAVFSLPPPPPPARWRRRKRWSKPARVDEKRAGESEGHRRWLSETPRPHDQCHGAFIVLQQKGAHQSTGISSRLISRGHPLALACFPSLRLTATIPTAALLSPLPRLFLSHSAPLAFFRPSAPPRRPSPPFFARSVGEGCGPPARGWATDSGTT